MRNLIRLPSWIETWLQWMTVTGVGWPLAVVVGMSLCAVLQPVVLVADNLAMGCLVGGVLIAFFQSLVLHQQMRSFMQWTFATVAGWTAGLAVLGAVP